MSIRREQQSELERIFYDFMEYYKYKNGKYYWNKPPYYQHPYDCYDKPENCQKHKHIHNHHGYYQTKPMPKPPYNMPYTTLPYYFITPFRADEYTLDPRATKILTPTTNCDSNETFPTVYTPNPEAYKPMDMASRIDMELNAEQKYYKALFNDLNKALMPYVEQVIIENNYEGSPINDKYFDRESLAQFVSEVLAKAKKDPKLVAYIEDLDPKVRELMKNMVQSLLLGELFVVHRPNTNLNTNNMTTSPYISDSPRAENNTHAKINIDDYIKDCGCEHSKYEPVVKTKAPDTSKIQTIQYFSN